MSKPVAYTQIPPTSDGAYWKLKSRDATAKLTVFVPRDKALHRALLAAQRVKVQAETVRRQQSGRGPQSQHATNKATWGLDAGGPI